MAINQSVLLPKEQPSPLDRLLKGLEIAQGVYGIKTAMEQSDLRKLQAENMRIDQEKAIKDEDFESRGGIPYNKIFDTVQVKEGTKGAREGLIKTQNGESKYFYKTEADLKRENIISQNEANEIAKGIKNSLNKSDNEFDKLKSLRASYQKESQNTLEALSGYKKVQAAATNPQPSGATDIALLFGYMKTIDPGSTVREGEFATARNAQGVPEKIKTLYNKIIDGETLAPEMRQKFLVESKRSILAQLQLQEPINNIYREMSFRYSIDPKFIINSDFDTFRENLSTQQPISTGIIPQNENTIIQQNQRLIGNGSTLQPITNIKQGMSGGNVFNWVNDIFSSTGTQDSSKMDDATFLKNYRGQ